MNIECSLGPVPLLLARSLPVICGVHTALPDLVVLGVCSSTDLDLPEELAQGPTGWLGGARDLPWMCMSPHWVEELWVPGHVLFGQELCYAMVGSGTGPWALLD